MYLRKYTNIQMLNENYDCFTHIFQSTFNNELKKDLNALFNLSCVCKKFNEIFNSNLIWQHSNIYYTNIIPKELHLNNEFKTIKNYCYLLKIKKYYKLKYDIIELYNLKELYLFDNDISNIEPLSKCIYNVNVFPNLKTLDLSFNKISNIEPISKANFLKLKELNLYSNQISNIEPLSKANFPKLKILNLYSNQILNIEPLSKANFPNLEKLYLYNNQISNIELFSNVNVFPNLKILDLGFNKISNIEPFSNVNAFPNLKILRLCDNKISNIGPLFMANFPNLEELNLHNIPISKDSILELKKIFNKTKIRF